ncbi:hypothetical protein GCM10027065_23890 [Rhodanobacter koreensis]
MGQASMQEKLTATNYMSIKDNYKIRFDDNTKLLAMNKSQAIHRKNWLFP